ncbi:MAG: DNA topoisomerase IV subunit A [Candidatus Aenigmarchaeota archaeon]|nr:DNA topoisomerase IV subunit A [Candidatus Aenigmarchaeota archaeon]
MKKLKLEISRKLKKLGEKVWKEILREENPFIEIPIRSLSNVIFDEKTKTLTLGDKTAKRYFFHIAHAKKFMQTLLVASFCKELVDQDLHTSLRDMFYALKRTLPNSKENTFDDQRESDPIVVDLEVTLNVLREQLHLNADVRGRVVGNVIIEDRGDVIDWSKLGSGGWAIPSNVEDIEFKKVKAKFILVVEKNAAFERLHEDKFWKKHKCILLTTQGQAARGARRLIQRLSTEFNLPVYVFTDSDPYGWYIYSVIKYGSMSLAHISDRLGTPSAKFIGLTISDIDRFGLHNWTIKAKDVDIKRAKEMLRYEWFKHPKWQRELKLMIKRKYKAELEALSGKGLKFVSEVYLPTKIKEGNFLP